MKDQNDFSVIFAIPNMCGGGAERVISLLANEFARRDIDTKIMMISGNNCVYKLDSRIELTQVGERTGGSFIKRIERIKSIRRYLKGRQNSVIISFEPDCSFFIEAADIGLNIPIISSERNDPSSFGNDKTRKIAYDHSDLIVFQTYDAKNYFSQKIQEKGCIIENPINTSLPKRYEGIRKKNIVSVGRLEPQKNQKLLLTAFSVFSGKFPEYTLELYGKGSMEAELKKIAENLGISDKVVFKGFYSDVTDRIIDAGMYVLSSDYEGISNSLLEALAVGLPVIATDCPCGGTGMCIQNGVNGILVPVKDKDLLVMAMTELAERPEKAAELGRNASKIREIFSVEVIADKWVDAIKEVRDR